MKYLNSRLTLLLVLFFTTVLPLAAITVDEVPNVHVADRTQYVSNPSGILSSAAVSNLNAQIGALWANTSAELVVVAVDQVDPSMTPEEFATKLFEKWKIGKRTKTTESSSCCRVTTMQPSYAPATGSKAHSPTSLPDE